MAKAKKKTAKKKVSKKTSPKKAAKKVAKKKVAKKVATKKKVAKKAATKKKVTKKVAKKKVAKKTVTKKKVAKKKITKKKVTKKVAKKAATKKKVAKKAATKKKVAAKTTSKTTAKKAVKKSAAKKTAVKSAKTAENKKAQLKVEQAPLGEIPLDTSEDIEDVLGITEFEEEVVLTDAEGRRYCRARDCDQVALVEAYCRYHYLDLWKMIQVRRKILNDGKLEKYIMDLTTRYSDKIFGMIWNDMRSEKNFWMAIQDMEIDSGAIEEEESFENEAQSFINEVHGVDSGSEDEDKDNSF